MRRRIARGLDVLAVLIVLVAVVKFFVLPRLGLEAPRPAPALALARMDGGARYDLGAHRGRVVFLDFWASWCEPCRFSIPLVQEFARRHPEVDVVSVDVGEPPAVATAFARAHRMRGVVFDQTEAATRAFGVVSYPTMVVVDPRGMIRNTWIGYNPGIETAMAAVSERYRREVSAAAGSRHAGRGKWQV